MKILVVKESLRGKTAPHCASCALSAGIRPESVLIVSCYPVYMFPASGQLHRLIEQIEANYKFYRQNHFCNFLQKQTGWILQMVGAMLAIPGVQKKMKGKMSTYNYPALEKAVERVMQEQK